VPLGLVDEGVSDDMGLMWVVLYSGSSNALVVTASAFHWKCLIYVIVVM
jgi:hypothetical protein